MRANTLLVCGLAAFAHAQTPPGELLHEVSRKVLDTVGRLPKYMCTQTIDRFQDQPVPGHPEPVCEPSPHKQLRLYTSDRLRLDVAVSGSQEMYSWVGESHFEDRTLFELVGNGALSTGSFSAFLTVIFRADNAAFTYHGPVTEKGRQLEKFEYRVPKEMSSYVYTGAGNRVVTGYYGAIFVDPKTADLVRLEVHTEGLPPETGSCQANSTSDYGRLRLNDTDFLLPSRTELHILDANGVELRNTTVYSDCHEFLGESTLHFESAPGLHTAAAGEPGRPSGELPAGLPFEIAFTSSIDPASAAAGDRIGARLTGPIRGQNRQTLAPPGAAVTARILQIRRYYVPTPSLRMVLKLETIEIGGTPQRLSAKPEARPTVGGRGSLERGSFVHLLLDSQDPAAAVLQVANANGNLVVASGFKSGWLTAAR